MAARRKGLPGQRSARSEQDVQQQHGCGRPAVACHRQPTGWGGMSQHHTQYGDLPLYIGGEACPSASDEWIEVTDPADQHLLARVPKATSAEIELAVRAAHDAYLLWREVPAPSGPG